MFKVFGFLFGMAFLSIGAFCLIPFGGGKRDNSDTLFCLALIAGGLTLSLFAMGGIEELVSALIAFFGGTVFGVLFLPLVVFGPFGVAAYVFVALVVGNAIWHWISSLRR